MTSVDSTGREIAGVSEPYRLDEAQLAAVAFLARYSGRTLDAYRHDLRTFFQWAADRAWRSRRDPGPHRAVPGLDGAGAWPPRRSTGGCRPCAGSTGSPTSTAGSRPTRPSTCAGQGATRRGAWHGPRRARPLPVHRRAVRPRPRRAGGAVGPQRAAGQRSLRRQYRRLGLERGHRDLRIVGKGNKPAVIPLVPRTAPDRSTWPSGNAARGRSCTVTTANDWTGAPRTAGCAPSASGPGSDRSAPPHAPGGFHHGRAGRRRTASRRATRRRHADPRTTTIYDRRRQNFDRHAAYVVVAFVAGG